MTDWTIIVRSLTSRMFSTIVTVLTVAVAVALLVVLESMRHAGRRAFDRGSGNMHLLVSADASPLVSVLNGIFYANPPRRPITWERYRQLVAALPAEWAIPTQLGDSYMGLPVLATTPDFFSRFLPDGRNPWRLASGRFFEKPFEVVVGARAARATGLRVGDRLHLTHGIPASRQARDHAAPEPHVHHEFTYEVVGILLPTGASHDRALFTDLTSSWTIHAHDRRTRHDPALTLTTPDDLTDADRLITGIYLRLFTRPGSDTPANLPQIFDMLRRDPTLTVAQPRQEIDRLFEIVSDLNRIFLAIGVCVLLASGVGIMLALYNSMEARRRQIAVLRVLGASRQRVFGLVLTESALIGLMGAVLGAAAAAIGARLLAAALKARLGVVITPELPPRVLLLVITGTVVLAAIAGLVPAVTAYRTSVARNLRPLG
jgi:putative ABC transport system permease protein